MPPVSIDQRFQTIDDNVLADAQRYHKLRSLEPYEYKELYRKVLQGRSGAFDEVLDAYQPSGTPYTVADGTLWGEPVVEDQTNF